jgi:hypothetical protein
MRSPKIAICWSGQLRTGLRAVPYLLKFFENIKADHFYHSWDDGEPQEDWDNLNELLNPIESFVETPWKHRGFCGNMLYSIQQSNWLKRQYELKKKFRYDIVIKCRFDLLVPVHKRWTYTNVVDRCIYYSIGNNGLVLTDFATHGLSDLIYWGNSHAMDIISDSYRYYNWNIMPKQHHCLTGGNIDPEDTMYSPGTIMYQLGQSYNLRMIQLDPQLGETLWRTSVKDLDPYLDWNEIRAAY